MSDFKLGGDCDREWCDGKLVECNETHFKCNKCVWTHPKKSEEDTQELILLELKKNNELLEENNRLLQGIWDEACSE